MEFCFLLTFFSGFKSGNAPWGRSLPPPLRFSHHPPPHSSPVQFSDPFNCNLVCLVSELPDRGRQRGKRWGGGEPADLWIALKFLQCLTHTYGNLTGWPGIWERRGQGHGSLSALHRAAAVDSRVSEVSGEPHTWVSQHSGSIPLTLHPPVWRTGPVPERRQK